MANKENSDAAKKIASAEKEKTSKKSKSKKPNIFVRMGKAIKRYFKDLKGEVKKITWPGAKEVLKGTLVTMVCIAIIGAVVFVVDLGLTKGIGALRDVAENSKTTTSAVTESKTTTTTAATTTTTAPETTSSAAN